MLLTEIGVLQKDRGKLSVDTYHRSITSRFELLDYYIFQVGTDINLCNDAQNIGWGVTLTSIICAVISL